MSTEEKDPIKVDGMGFNYILKLPRKARRASIFDFVIIDLNLPEKYRIKANMVYLVQSADRSRYYIRQVHEALKDIDLNPLIVAGQVFVVV